jgi:hypothetical protein
MTGLRCLLSAAAAAAVAAAPGTFVVSNDAFMLNSKPVTLFSGSIHYHRVHPSLWRDRLQRLAGAMRWSISHHSLPLP